MLLKVLKDLEYISGNKVDLKTGDIFECDLNRYKTLLKIYRGSIFDEIPLYAVVLSEKFYYEGVYFLKGDLIKIDIRKVKDIKNIQGVYKGFLKIIDTKEKYEQIKKEYGLDQENKEEPKEEIKEEPQKRIRRTQEQIKKDNQKENDNN